MNITFVYKENTTLPLSVLILYCDAILIRLIITTIDRLLRRQWCCSQR